MWWLKRRNPNIPERDMPRQRAASLLRNMLSNSVPDAVPPETPPEPPVNDRIMRVRTERRPARNFTDELALWMNYYSARPISYGSRSFTTDTITTATTATTGALYTTDILSWWEPRVARAVHQPAVVERRARLRVEYRIFQARQAQEQRGYSTITPLEPRQLELDLQIPNEINLLDLKRSQIDFEIRCSIERLRLGI